MRCRTARKLLSRRLDGPLDAREAAALDDHVAGCAPCALAATRFETAWLSLVAYLPTRHAPDDFAGVLERIDRRQGWIASLLAAVSSLPARPAAALALAATVVLGAASGVALGRAAFGDRRTGSPPEAMVLAESFGVVPFGSPAAGIARALALGTEGIE